MTKRRISMPTTDASISWLGALGWLAAIIATSFLVAWALTTLLGVRRTPYIAALALLTGSLTVGYLAWSDTSLTGFATNRWGWGLVGAAVTGAILARLSRHQPHGPRPKGRRLAASLAWEGVVYGTAEGLLLSVLPVLATWQAFAAHGWTSGLGRALVAGIVAMAASLAVIVIHHLGYRGFHTRAALPPVMVGCGLLSLAYLLTASPLAAVGGHILLHTALTLRGTELPPYATGGAHIAPLGHQRPTSAPATPVA
jgi:MFS family permease